MYWRSAEYLFNNAYRFQSISSNVGQSQKSLTKLLKRVYCNYNNKKSNNKLFMLAFNLLRTGIYIKGKKNITAYFLLQLGEQNERIFQLFAGIKY